jgi:hypothetical protein
MEALAEQVREQSIGSVFLYTHEAHPGEYYPHHTSFEQKMAHARAFRELFSIRRQILVDSLDGAAHRRYGGMPNMAWIFDRGGRPVYKADWTNVDSIRSAIEVMLNMTAQRQAGRVFAPFRVERLEYRARDPQAFMAALERNGPKAAREFEEQSIRWQRRAGDA